MRLDLPLALLLVVPVLAGPPIPAAAVAMVTDAQGEVRRGPDAKALAITTEVEAGVPLKLKVGARLRLLVYGSGEEVQLTGPGKFTLNAKGTVSGPATGIRRTQGSRLSLKEALKPGGLAQASLVMRGPLDIDVLEPAQPVVRATPPQFRWAPVPGASDYTFSLRQAGGAVLHATTTKATAIHLPGGLQLQPGVKYQWAVSTSVPGVRLLHSEADLEVLDPARIQVIDRLRSEASKGFSHRLLYASTLQIYGLLAEAKAEWRTLEGQRPQDPMLQSLAR